ncbi:beta-lactamase [Colletotrichum plurivorum]|uniref:Beta-lactamase n=1 Tax=Colletotrichum plurivorum TaxID=2175906 RepID=A0A8H6J8V9_9PEZI|nr:beta-lactamase [Colletotrichum plurivorum]
MAQVNGTCDPKFEGVRDKFDELLKSGEELGASFAVTIDGKDVINLWGGFADPERSRPWTEDTIVNVYSTTKTVCALAILVLIDEGRLSPDDKVAKHWPEFAANGKQDIEVRHLISHTSGLAVFEEPITIEELCDLQLATSRLEKQAPRWEPGTASGYSAWTYGYPVGELIRRITGQSLTDFVAQKIAGPLGADFQIGAKEADWPRVAELVPPTIPAPPPGSSDWGPKPGTTAALMFNPLPNASFGNTAAWRRAEIGAANGHTNAAALARIWSRAATLGDDDERRLLSRETIDLIFREQSYGPDLVLGPVIRFGCGLGLRGNGDSLVDSWMPEGRICFWGGWGGSLVINDVDRRITIAYTMNKMSNSTAGNDAVISYIGEVYKALGVPIPGGPK